MAPEKNTSSSLGFNLIELLVVIATASALAVVVLPAFAKSDSRGQAFQCLSNNRRLVAAWMMYAEDNRGLLVSNPGSPAPTTPAWVTGNMQSPNDLTNTALIQSGLLFPYAKSFELYKCPGNHTAQIRGISMNSHVGTLSLDVSYQYFIKSTQIAKPSQIFVTMDEDPISVNDGSFYMKGQDLQSATLFIYDWPSAVHDGAGVISFADGHSDLHRWKYLGRFVVPYDPAAGMRLTGSRVTDGKYLVQISTLPTSGGW